jgi:DNA-binding transcriptional LysR family regulator
MAPRIASDSQISRRLRLRDLHVFAAAARLGSMAKAASELGVTQPAVSEVIAGLEHALGVRLLDRTRRGVQPTPFGTALLKRSVAAFDELRQGIRDIEFLSDPTVGELRIACPESIAAGLLQPIIARFAKSHPRVVLDVDTLNTPGFAPRLRDRSLDLMLARSGWPLDQPALVEDLAVETLFEDDLVVAVGHGHPLARRRRLSWMDLADQPWVLSASHIWNHVLVSEAFAAHGLKPPTVLMTTLSVHLRAHMVASRPCITTFPRSVMLLQGKQLRLKALPVALPPRPWPIFAVTLRERTPGPILMRFLQQARTVSRSLSGSTPRRDRSLV